jgi:hypothetical protein
MLDALSMITAGLKRPAQQSLLVAAPKAHTRYQ